LKKLLSLHPVEPPKRGLGAAKAMRGTGHQDPAIVRFGELSETGRVVDGISIPEAASSPASP
jgi:hypothetical protein